MKMPPLSARLRPGQSPLRGFTLVEVLVSTALLISLLLVTAAMVSQTATLTGYSNQRMSTDSEARQTLDRISMDIASAVLRSDLPPRIGKSAASDPARENDSLGLYTQSDGYEGDRGVSLISYGLVNGALHREARGTSWEAGDGSPLAFNTAVPPGALAADSDLMAADVFRFELVFLMRDGSLKSAASAFFGNTPSEEVAAIIVGIAVLDGRSREKMQGSIEGLSGLLDDAQDGRDILSVWNEDLNAPGFYTPPAGSDYPGVVRAAIRVYQRCIYLNR